MVSTLVKSHAEGTTKGVAFSTLTCAMIPVVSSLSDIPDDLEALPALDTNDVGQRLPPPPPPKLQAL